MYTYHTFDTKMVSYRVYQNYQLQKAAKQVAKVKKLLEQDLKKVRTVQTSLRKKLSRTRKSPSLKSARKSMRRSTNFRGANSRY